MTNTKRDVRNEVRKMIKEAKEANKFEGLTKALEMLQDQTKNKKAAELVAKIEALLGNKIEAKLPEFIKPATIFIEIKKVTRPDLVNYDESMIGQQIEVYAEKIKYTTALLYTAYVEGKTADEVTQEERRTFRNDDIKIVK